VNLYSKLKAWLAIPWTTATNADRAFIQVGHILGGYSIAMSANHFHAPLWLCAVLVQVWAVPKEFWFDYRYEDAATRGSSPLDFSMYQVGLAFAALVIR
jgi:hypothetical protein